MVSRVAEGGPASKDDGLKVQDRILKVRRIPPPVKRNFHAPVLAIIVSDMIPALC